MATDPFALAADLLARVAAYFSTHGISLPDNQYVAPGDSKTIAYDYEALMVNIDFTGTGRPGSTISGQSPPSYLRYGQFAVTILRNCVTQNDDGTPPTPDVIQADAVTNMSDVMNLQNAMNQIMADCQGTGGWVGPNTPLALLNVETLGPQGAMMAALATVQVSLL